MTVSPKALTRRVVVGPHSLLVRNGVTFNDRSTDECIWVEEFNGFERPDLNTPAEQNPQEDGETPFDSSRGGRTMTLSGEIVSGSYTRALEMAADLEDSLIDLLEWPMTIKPAPKTALAHNVVPNPKAKYNATDGGWGLQGGTGQTLNRIVLGSETAFDVMTPNTPVPTSMRHPGARFFGIIPTKLYIAAVDVRAAATGRPTQVYIDWYDAAGVRISVGAGGSLNNVVGSWVRPFRLAFAPANAVSAQIIAEVNPAVANEHHYFTRFYFDMADTLPAYGDGDTDMWEWDGADNNSASTLYDSYFRHPDVEISCRPTDWTIDKKLRENDMRGLLRRTFSVALRASNPRFTSVASKTTSMTMTSLVFPVGGGGFTFPAGGGGLTFPALDGTLSAANVGNWPALPVIRFFGSLKSDASYRLTNTTNGQVMVVKGPIASGGWIDVDVYAGTVVDQLGNNVADQFDSTSDWTQLEGKRSGSTGTNDFTLVITGSASPPAGGVVRFIYDDTWMSA